MSGLLWLMLALEVGATRGDIQMGQALIPLDVPLYALFSARGGVGPLFIEGSIRNRFSLESVGVPGGVPDRDEYFFGGGLTFKGEGWGLDGGFRHYCTHPVYTWVHDREVPPAWERWYEELYVSVKIEHRWF